MCNCISLLHLFIYISIFKYYVGAYLYWNWILTASRKKKICFYSLYFHLDLQSPHYKLWRSAEGCTSVNNRVLPGPGPNLRVCMVCVFLIISSKEQTTARSNTPLIIPAAYFSPLLVESLKSKKTTAYLSSLFCRMQPSMISFTSGMATLSKLLGFTPWRVETEIRLLNYCVN